MNLKLIQKQSRETRKYTAKMLKIPKQTYDNYVDNRREPDLKTSIKIANHFRVTLDYLAGNEKNQFQLQLGYLNDDQKNAIKKLITLNQINFIKAYSYISGLYAGQS